MEQEKNKTVKSLELHCRQGEFKNDRLEQVAFSTFYVVLMGVEVRLIPKDGTAKQLLEGYFQTVK